MEEVDFKKYRISLPYFFLAMDCSGSMEENDPLNFESESLKNIIRTIYYNGKFLFEEVEQYPILQIVTFGDGVRNLTPKDNWFALTSEEDVLTIDKIIDRELNKRTDGYTDFNYLVDYALNSWNTIANRVDSFDRTMILIIFTDGEIYPNFLHKINHPDNESFMSYKNRIEQLKKEDGLSTYQLNKTYGYEDKQRLQFAKNEVQKRLYKQLSSKKYPSIQLNIIDLKSLDMEYMKKWVSNLGTLYPINNPQDIGQTFIDIMSNNLNTTFESGTTTSTYNFKPFTRDIVACELLTMFSDIHTKEISHDYYQISNYQGQLAEVSKLNDNLKYSKFSYLSEKNPNFNDTNGWYLNVEKNDNNQNLSWFLITIHDYILDIQIDKESQKSGETKYIIRLVNMGENSVIELEDYEKPLEINIFCTDRKDNEQEVAITKMNERGEIHADFSNWSAGNYIIDFKIIGGRLKEDICDLRHRKVTKNIELNKKILIFDTSGNQIERIFFDHLDNE